MLPRACLHECLLLAQSDIRPLCVWSQQQLPTKRLHKPLLNQTDAFSPLISCTKAKQQVGFGVEKSCTIICPRGRILMLQVIAAAFKIIRPQWQALPDGSYTVTRQGTLLVEVAPAQQGTGSRPGERRYEWDNKLVSHRHRQGPSLCTLLATSLQSFMHVRQNMMAASHGAAVLKILWLLCNHRRPIVGSTTIPGPWCSQAVGSDIECPRQLPRAVYGMHDCALFP